MTFNIEVIIFHFQILFKFKDRKSTRLNSSHLGISYAVFCLKKKKNKSELQSLRKLLCSDLIEKKTVGNQTTYTVQSLTSYFVLQTHSTDGKTLYISIVDVEI